MFDRHGDIEAPPVVFAHGFGQTALAWSESARRVARHGWQAFALDGRGHGRSSWNLPQQPYRMEQFVEDLCGFASARPAAPVLVGASMGGLLGLLAEGESPRRLFRALVLVDVTPRWESRAVERILGFMGAHPDGFGSLSEAADAISVYLPHRRSRKTPEQLRGLLVQRDDGRWRWHWDPRLLDEIARDVERHQLRLLQAAARVRVPTLLVSGGLSDLVSDSTIAEFLRLVPHAEHRRIVDATHMVVGDRNDQFTDTILEFLAALPGEPAGE